MKALAFGLALLAAPALAQEAPADLTTLPPVPSAWSARTEWGDPDLRAKYNLDMTGRRAGCGGPGWLRPN